jgi:hypothetical protein
MRKSVGWTLLSAALGLLEDFLRLPEVGSGHLKSKSKAADKRVRPTFQPGVKLLQGQLALLPMPLLAIANFAFQRRQQVESDVRGLEISRIGVGYVVH